MSRQLSKRRRHEHWWSVWAFDRDKGMAVRVCVVCAHRQWRYWVGPRPDGGERQAAPGGQGRRPTSECSEWG